MSIPGREALLSVSITSLCSLECHGPRLCGMPQAQGHSSSHAEPRALGTHGGSSLAGHSPDAEVGAELSSGLMPVLCQPSRVVSTCSVCAHSWSTNVDSSRKFLCLFLSVFFFLFNKVDCLQPVAKEEPPPPATKFQSIGVQVEDEWR